MKVIVIIGAHTETAISPHRTAQQDACIFLGVQSVCATDILIRSQVVVWCVSVSTGLVVNCC